MNIHLAGIGWVTDAPQGHRLRWHYPVDAIDAAGNHLGLPTTIIVERAPVASHDRTEHPLATVSYPVQWWDSHGDITAASVVPLIVQPLPKPSAWLALAGGVALLRMLELRRRRIARV